MERSLTCVPSIMEMAMQTRSALALKVPPLALALATAALMALLAGVSPWFEVTIPARTAAAVVLVLAGCAFAAAAIAAFRRARTTVNPLAPARASVLVDSGVYRVSRNPMYLGVALILLGWALWLAHLLALALVPAFVVYIDRLQIVAEEQALAQRFGAKFAAYRASTRRWL
jgi:protein-S-isoprenylcysteine O-methyltransferase Ste14